MIKRMIVMLIAVGVVLGAFFGFQAFKASIIKKVMAALANPPQTVSTVTAGVQSWQNRIKAIGGLRAASGADLSLEVAGVVDAIDFQSGDDVPAGKILLRLRDNDDVARLQALQATADLAQITYDRDMKQFKTQAISQATLDTDQFNLRNAKASVAQQQAVLDKKMLRAPFAGHLGIRQVDIGQYLTPGAAVVTLQVLDPIFMDFYMPQQSLDQLRLGQAIAAQVDTWPGKTFPGKIVAIDPRVDPNSRNVMVRASFENGDHRLLPGMFATAEIDVGQPTDFVTLPQTAITYNPYGSTVFLVRQQGSGAQADQTFVTTGATRGDQVAVLTGIKAGDVVVTSGQMKLRNGSPVKINNQVQPTDNPSPHPSDQ
jgi:membrane fusion protein, multidrug efflux system